MKTNLKLEKKYTIIYTRTLTTFLFIILVLAGCSNSNTSKDLNENTFIRKSSFLLNTIVTVTIYDKQEEELLDKCFDLIKHYESIFSRTDPNSELYALNNNNNNNNNNISPQTEFSYPISLELADLLQYGISYGELSNGLFDITIASVTDLWDFTSTQPSVPSEEKITSALVNVNYKNIKLLNSQITLQKEGIRIDLGAIAKGYIADKVKDYLYSVGVESAMINLGGNILCVGNKPDGSPFRVGIQKPFADRNETIEIMEISDFSVVSSGIYERFFLLDDQLYHHILNPYTGYPIENDLVAVTIISKTSVDGDGLSTTCFALGFEDGLRLVNSLSDVYAIFITTDYEVHYSEGFHDTINLVQ